MQIAQESSLKVQTGGGLRDLSQIQHLLQGGVERAVIGSLAVTNPQMVKFWINEVGQERICVALDINVGKDGEPYPATRGWTEAGSRTLWNVLDDYMGTGLSTILVTDISKDGVLGGANVKLYKKILANYPTLNLLMSKL